MTDSTGGLPLQGVRVLELSSYVATPLCGLTLAQLGADVVRVEPPGGAPDRTRLPMSDTGTSYYWTGLNKGKRAIAVDLSTEEGQETVADLAAQADVVVANAPYKGAVTAEALRERNPGLVHIRLSGTWSGAPSVDYLVQAGLGFPQVTGPPGHLAPVNHPLPAWDVAAGLHLATGVLAALHGRRETGQGASITLALEDVALATVGNLGLLSQAQFESIDRPPEGNYVYGPYGRDFQLADGRRILWSLYRTFDETAESLGDNPLFAEVDQPGIGRHLAPGSPLVFDQQRHAPHRAPRVGEHTDDILAERLAGDTAGPQSHTGDRVDNNRRTA